MLFEDISLSRCPGTTRRAAIVFRGAVELLQDFAMPSPESSSPVACISLRNRLSAGISGALVGATLAAALLAGLSLRTGEVSWVSSFGLLASGCLLLSLLVGLWVAVVHPGSRLPALSHLLDSKQRRFRAALSGPAIVIVWVLVGQLALRLLAAFPQRPAAGGVLIAASALGILTGGAFLVDRSANLLVGRVPAPSRRLAMAISLGVPALFVPGLILTGTTSGVGSPWAFLGTFRRPELDLSPVIQLVFVAAFAYLGARWARSWATVVQLVGVVVSVGLAGWSFHSASRISFREAVSIERSRDLSAGALSVLRGASDRDGDGYSSSFGGGDCDDARRDVHPGAVDVPDNGVDEDCRGGDRKAAPSPTENKEPELEAPTLPPNANVLLLTIDTLRWDLGYSGHAPREGLSPELDAFAERSTVFERAYSLASYTSKSLGPMLIGKYPSETKRTFEHFDRFSTDETFVQERIGEEGIQTVSVQGYWYFFFKGYGFERGWDVLDSSAAPRAVTIEGDKTSNGDEVAERVVQQLTDLSKSDERFFLWAHWVDPHAEYVPHEAFDFGSESRERYDGEVAFVDHQIGKILDALDSLSLAESTVVIITSDHGEAFGEHGMIRHGFEVWEELVRVPLLIHVPGAEPKRVSERRSLVDVGKTIYDALSIELSEDERAALSGTSLLSDVLGDEKPVKRPVLVDMPEGPHNRERRAFYLDNHKLITTSGRVLGLYDLKNDPNEKKDLSGDKELVEKVQSAMDAFLDTLSTTPATR